MKNRRIALLIIVFALSLLASATVRAQPKDNIVALMDEVRNLHLIADVQHFADYGTRFCGSQNAWPVALDLLSRMNDLGWETGLQEFSFDHDTLGVVTSWNVVARRGGTAPNATIVLCAHWDSVDEWPGGSYDDPEAPAPGANDNGSGIAVLLEIARILRDHQFIQDVEIVFFGAEEVGLKGSEAYVSQHNILGSNIAGVFNVDSVGYDADDFWDFSVVSDHQSEWFMWNVVTWNSWYTPELFTETWSIPGGWSNSDAYSFWQNNPPDPAVSLWEGMWWDSDEHAPYGNHALDTYENCISNHGNFLTVMAKMTLASFCEWAIVGERVTDVADLPTAGGELVIYPNPFRERTAISLASGEASSGATLEIYDVLGRRVRSLSSLGTSPVFWDGRDSNGVDLPSGVYFVRAAEEPSASPQRIVLLR